MEPAIEDKLPPLEDIHVAEISHARRKAKKSSKMYKELVAQDEVRALADALQDWKTLHTDNTTTYQTPFNALIIRNQELVTQQIVQ